MLVRDRMAGGGFQHVRAVVHAAREDWNTHVFGLRDRDFTGSDRGRWSDEAVWMFAGESLEVENLMLDAEAITACENGGRKSCRTSIPPGAMRRASTRGWPSSSHRPDEDVAKAHRTIAAEAHVI